MTRKTQYFDGDDSAFEIELRPGSDNYKVSGTIYRVPIRRSGWWAVRYLGKQYQLLGGIRGPLFICPRQWAA